MFSVTPVSNQYAVSHSHYGNDEEILVSWPTLIFPQVCTIVCVMESLTDGVNGKHLTAPRRNAGSRSIKFRR
jgi:hypothetical protein